MLAGVSWITKHCDSLQQLTIGGGHEDHLLTDQSLLSIANNLPSLRSLSLKNFPTTNTTTSNILRICQQQHHQTLTSIKVPNITTINTAVVEQICLRLPNLEILDIANTAVDNHVSVILAAAPVLKKINIGKLEINDQGLLQLHQNCPNLRKIYLNHNPLSIKGILQFLSEHKKLHTLVIEDGPWDWELISKQLQKINPYCHFYHPGKESVVVVTAVPVYYSPLMTLRRNG